MKKSLVIALALMLVLAFASSAMAAQALQNGSYLSTTATGLDNYAGVNPNTTFNRTQQASKFTVDGYTYYPYEIYLPNEEDPASYRIHSNYTANTDACASCHATHTAVGASLLQWYSVYETCMACHDGTLGNATYNVEEGKIGSTTASTFGGMFGTGSEESLSNHNVTGSMEIAAAPGGSTVATKTDAEGNALNWTIEFGCQSCHTPHGQGGNARILHPDANYAASAAAEARGNKYFTGAGGAVFADADNLIPVYILKGYPYSPKVTDTDGIFVNPAYKIDNTSGLSIVVDAAGDPVVDADVYVIGVAGLQVQMDINNYLQDTETVDHVYGMNFYCGACHTDYNTAAFMREGSAAEETGVYAQAHRHQMGMDWYHETEGLELEKTDNPYAVGTMECLTCHVAHGVSEDYWTATLVGKVTGWDAGMVATGELAGSSALKRMPNMGTCEACHEKGEGNEGYNANAGIVGYTENDDVLNGSAFGLSTYGVDLNRAALLVADPAATVGVGSAKCAGCHQEYVDGWSETSHATSSHTGASSCGRCHNPGNSVMNISDAAWTVADTTAKDVYLAANPFAAVKVGTTTYLGADTGITCESCHGNGTKHIAAPSAKNIFNPGTTSIERQAIECGKCHDVFNNNTTIVDTFGLSTVSGVTYTGTVAGSSIQPSKAKLADLVTLANWSVAFRTAGQDPAKFADATQLNATSNHYGGAWGYGSSKHFIGTGTTENPNGVVTCNTCHDMHSDKHTGLLKYSYEQICASCHDASASLEIAVAMPTNNWNRHQIEANDFAHSFKFGAPATVAAVTILNANLESASTDFMTFTGDTYHYTYAAGNQVSGAYGVGSNTNLWRSSQTGGGGIGKKVLAYSDAGKTTRVYNNYEMTWTIVSVPATVTEGVDFVQVPEGGALEFTNPGTGVIGDYAKFAGEYKMHYVVNSNPALNGDVSFTIVP